MANASVSMGDSYPGSTLFSRLWKRFFPDQQKLAIEMRAVFEGQSAEEVRTQGKLGKFFHAFALSTAFKTANSDVSLLINAHTSPELFQDPSVIASARAFIERGGHLRVLLECSSSLSFDGFLKTLSERPGAVEVRMLPANVMNKYNSNFVVTERACFVRPNREQDKGIARGGPAHEDRVRWYTDNFNNKWEVASPYQPLILPRASQSGPAEPGYQ